LLRNPIETFWLIIDEAQFGKKFTDTKYLMYSSHDWTVAQVLDFFRFTTSKDFEMVPFAS
jgi:hypothetical protein